MIWSVQYSERNEKLRIFRLKSRHFSSVVNTETLTVQLKTCAGSSLEVTTVCIQFKRGIHNQDFPKFNDLKDWTPNNQWVVVFFVRRYSPYAKKPFNTKKLISSSLIKRINSKSDRRDVKTTLFWSFMSFVTKILYLFLKQFHSQHWKYFLLESIMTLPKYYIVKWH